MVQLIKLLFRNNHTIDGHNCEVKKTFSKQEIWSAGSQRGLEETLEVVEVIFALVKAGEERL
jgi:hypothetical protein